MPSPPRSSSAAKSRRTYTRRSPRTRINDAIDELKELIMKQCNFTASAVRTAARTAAEEVMNNGGGAAPAPATAAPFNPFNNMFSSPAAPATRTRGVTKVPLATKLEAAGAAAAPMEAPKSKHPGPGLWNRYLRMFAEMHEMKVSEARESNEARSAYQAARNSGTIEQELADFEAMHPPAPARTRAPSVTRKASAREGGASLAAAAVPAFTGRPLTTAPANNAAAKAAASADRLAQLRAKMAAKRAAPAPAKGVRLNLGQGQIARPANTPFNLFAAPPAAAEPRNLNNV